MKTLIALILSAILCACANGPVVPDWQMNAKSGMERATSAYFSGNDRVADQEFTRARSDMASTGRFDLVARIELIRCANHVASLAFDECTGFEKLRQDAGKPERAYADYLAGKGNPQDAELLPPTQRSLMLAHDGTTAVALAAIADPDSRLVAAGVLLRSGRATPEVFKIAVDTASAQGWRRPLLAWLGAQKMRAEKSGDMQEAGRLQRQIDLVGSSSQQ